MLSFLGIGAQKAGTTWLYEMMCRHPLLAFPLGKEAHFWGRPRSPGDKKYYHQVFSATGRFAGEMTPAYALLNNESIVELKTLAPGLRLIYQIRNPIDRAWSSALMALQRAGMTFNEASDQWFIDHFYSLGSRSRGDYETTIRNWHGVFGKDALLILRYEWLTDDPYGLLALVAHHLDVSAEPFACLPNSEVNQRIFSGNNEPIRETLRPVLERLYLPKIEALSAYLDESLPWF